MNVRESLFIYKLMLDFMQLPTRIKGFYLELNFPIYMDSHSFNLITHTRTTCGSVPQTLHTRNYKEIIQ